MRTILTCRVIGTEWREWTDRVSGEVRTWLTVKLLHGSDLLVANVADELTDAVARLDQLAVIEADLSMSARDTRGGAALSFRLHGFTVVPETIAV